MTTQENSPLNQKQVWVDGPLRLGVVGVRGIGQAHIRRAKSVPEAEVVAIADMDSERLAEVQAEYDIPRAYQDALKLFTQPDIHGVILALPNHLHKPMSIAAMEAGKHVLVEKPVASHSVDAQAMIAVRNSTKRVLMVGMNQRFSPEIAAVKVHLAGGTIGDLLYARAYWNRRRIALGLWQRGEWFLDWRQAGGGPLIDLGIHKLDLALYLMDFPAIESVTGVYFTGIGQAEGAKYDKAYGVEDLGVGLIRLAGNKAISLESGFFTHEEMMDYQHLFLNGTKGGYRLGLGFNEPGTDTTAHHLYIADGEAIETVPLDPPDLVAHSAVEHFCQVLRGQTALSSTAEQALTGLRIIEAIYQSAETGEMVVWGSNRQDRR